MKINETITHYIGLFSGKVLIIIFALLGWKLTEYSDWFANVWASEFNRVTLTSCFACGAIWLSVYTYSYFWGKRKLIRTFKANARSTISKCTDGDLVRIQGELNTLPALLNAPFSQRQCSAYSIKASRRVERATSSNSGSHVSSEKAWETFTFVELANDFLIRCENHFALVRSKDAKIIIQPDTVHDESSYSKDRGGFLTEDENTKRKQTLAALSVSPNQYIGVYGVDVKFEEGVLAHGEQVAVLGRGHWINTDAYQELRILTERGIDKVYEIATDTEQKLFISDSVDVLEQELFGAKSKLS
ncbi:hypothetical protein [Rheinheimera sp. SA_1]|uniref:hypothetical protein n=1 Tax=Rheinheimera sp. SA_1 TaxID=1827365 RepID=UPI000AA018B6|nr:hypothetical protein [Rheinheimera sp. SA_1]